MIRKALFTDIDKILEITSACAKHMISNHIYQWNEHYPNKVAFENDIKLDELYVFEIDKEIIGCIALTTKMDDEYNTVNWLTPNANNLYIHRLAVHPKYQGKGYAQKLMSFAEDFAIKNNYRSIRLDTFSQNNKNQKFYELRGYKKLKSVVYFTKQSKHPFLLLRNGSMIQNISFKHINKLAIPALISGISEPILSITDTAIVGNMKVDATESLAAVGIVGAFISMLVWVLGQTRSAISSIVSQYLGANQLDKVKNLPAQAIFIITSLSILIIIGTYPFAKQIFQLYNASNLILDYSIDYYKIRVFGFPFTLFTIAVFGAFRGLQDTFHPMIIAIIGALTNIILDIVFVYGIDGFIPAMNIKGAAYASVAAQLVMAILSTYYLLKKTDIPLLVTFPFNKEIKRFLLLILNLFVRTLALNVTLYFASAYATSYGKQYIAAYTIAINLWFLGAFLIDGYSSAGNILSGKLYGAKQHKLLIQLSNTLIKYGIVVGFVLMVIGFVIYYPLGDLFTNDPEVLNAFYEVFWIVLLMQPICAVAFIFDGFYKGLGMAKYLRNVVLLATFLVYLPILFLLDSFDLKLYAIFIAMTFWMTARGIPLIIHFRKLFAHAN